ncbi:hypothetical protein [Bradyrhizobium sp. CB2312]|uniref:hypothetical protein n=2 Tax=Bradyrhizobium TaxID=374 RepID=UPI0024B14ABC|nr:hypothetical protein [Bradyrhizobium sp. CB2312]WFU71517.1 hypothetical protein QA642_41195 [Bradyrhizobium sp. CB2312]
MAAWRPTTHAPLMSADQASEIARLRQENEQLRMERYLSRKSTAIFAGTGTVISDGYRGLVESFADSCSMRV